MQQLQLPVIPSPQHVQWVSPCKMQLTSPTRVCVRSTDPRAHEVSSWLCDQLRECTDLVVLQHRQQQECSDSDSQHFPQEEGSAILLHVLCANEGTLPFPEPQPAEHVAHEAYFMSIEPEPRSLGITGSQQQGQQAEQLPPARCHVTASNPHGLFNGCQSLLQVCH